jgi:hypothetical protein
MEKVIINPFDQNPNAEDDLICKICGNQIHEQNVFKFTLGTTVSNVYFPGTITAYYHPKCINNS